MGIGDDIKNTAEDLKGKAKEAAGKATNDKSTTCLLYTSPSPRD